MFIYSICIFSFFQENFELIKLLPEEELNSSSKKKIETMEETQIYFWYDDTSFIFFMFTSFYINSRITVLKLIKPLKLNYSFVNFAFL